MLLRYVPSVSAHILVSATVSYSDKAYLPTLRACGLVLTYSLFILFKHIFHYEKIRMPPIALSFFQHLACCRGNGIVLGTFVYYTSVGLRN